MTVFNDFITSLNLDPVALGSTVAMPSATENTVKRRKVAHLRACARPSVLLLAVEHAD